MLQSWWLLEMETEPFAGMLAMAGAELVRPIPPCKGWMPCGPRTVLEDLETEPFAQTHAMAGMRLVRLVRVMRTACVKQAQRSPRSCQRYRGQSGPGGDPEPTPPLLHSVRSGGRGWRRR
jgi:hypothetical protein